MADTADRRPLGPARSRRAHARRAFALLLGEAAILLAATGSVLAQDADLPLNEKTTPHLRVSWRATSASLPPGGSAALVVEVVPNSGIRVYAPGQLEYIPVSLLLEPADGLAFSDPKLPNPVEHVFPPTGERSQVFDRPFRMEVPVARASRRPARTGASTARTAARLTVHGTFEYQACDDTVCYRPVRVAMSWTFDTRREAKTRTRKAPASSH